LKESWAGERNVPADLSKAVAEYLCDLKAKLDAVADFAEQHSKHAQDKYAVYYNLQASEKSFMEGDQVVLGDGKMNSRCQGPGKGKITPQLPD